MHGNLRHRKVGFVEKPPPGQAPTDWINAGTYILEPSVLARMATTVDHVQDRALGIGEAEQRRFGIAHGHRLLVVAEARVDRLQRGLE